MRSSLAGLAMADERQLGDHVNTTVVETQESFDGKAFGERVPVAPSYVLQVLATPVVENGGPVRRNAFVVAVALRLRSPQQVGAYLGRVDVKPRIERRLENDYGGVGVHQGGAGDGDPQVAFRRAAVDAVIRVRRIVDESSAFFQPGVDGVPRHVDEAGCFRLGLGRQAADLVSREHVAERVALPGHHQRAFCVDYRAPVLQGLDAPRMWLDVDEIGGHRRGEAPGALSAEGTPSGYETHSVSVSAAQWCGPDGDASRAQSRN